MTTSIIKHLLKAKKKTQKQLAEAIGVSENGLVKMFDNGRFKDSTLKSIAEYLEVSVAELLETNTTKVVPADSKQVPYYDIDATAGNVTIFQEDGTEYIKEYISVPAFSDCEMFINVSGSSMYPKYCSGELIALKRLKDFEVVAYGEAYLIVTDEQRLLKYIRKSKEKNMWQLCSEHPEHDPFDIHIAKVRYLYIVKGKITKNII